MTPQEEDAYLNGFEPTRDADGRVCEDANVYASRMHESLLPEWPLEVLVEWFYRHAGHFRKYAFLRFERFRFERQTWPLADIPGPEAFSDSKFCADFADVEERAEQPYDWLARYMVRAGTWNAPVILLNTMHLPPLAAEGKPIRSPVHLLEGHRRLAFLNSLRASGKALPEHEVWLVHFHNAANET